MVFLRAFTIIIVSISISRIIISTSRTDENEKVSKKVDVHLWGYLNCDDCGGQDVLINLKSGGTKIFHFNGNCKSIFYNDTTTDNLPPKLTADFMYYCRNKTTWINNISPNCTHLTSKWYEFYDCRFGVVDFKKSKKRVTRKRRNRKRIV